MRQPFKVFGITFAPLSIPFQRRLQTFCMWIHINFLAFVSTAIILLLLYLFFFTKYYVISVAYVVWYIRTYKKMEQGGDTFIYGYLRGSLIYRYFADYFPARMVKTADLDPGKTYLFGSHPHGILCFGAFMAFATDALDFPRLFPGIRPRLLTLKHFHYLPGIREMLLSNGCCAASRESIETLLRNPSGTAAVLVVGGAREVMYCDEDKIELVMSRRKGFIRLALKHGRDLVPTFSFGENFVYDQLLANPEGSWVRRFQDWWQRWLLVIPPIFMNGRGMFQYTAGSMPHRRPITVVVGAPIKVSLVLDPTPEEVDRVHTEYLAALKELYEEYNPKYGNKKIKLVIR